jgi:AraC-like DNA-binding protein
MADPENSTATTSRLAGWRDLVRERFVALEIAAPEPERFTGTVRNTRVGHLDVATVDSTSQVCRRTAGLASRDSEALFQVGLLTRGAAVLSQDGREARLARGGYAVYETDRPFVWDLSGDWQLQVFTWSRPMVALSPAASRRMTARSLDGEAGIGGIVGRMLQDLAEAPPRLSLAGGTRLAEEVAELVATVAGESPGLPAGPAGSSDLLRRIDDYIAEHLADPGLGAAQIARSHFLSTRHLHRLFAEANWTVGLRIRAQRLERCRRDLSSAATDVPVAVIARRWGFADPASFSRAFRASFGTTPTRYRAEHSPRDRRAGFPDDDGAAHPLISGSAAPGADPEVSGGGGAGPRGGLPGRTAGAGR